MTEEQERELESIWNDVKGGTAKNGEAKRTMIRWYNEVKEARYKETTSCHSCLNRIYKFVKQEYTKRYE